MAKTSVACIAFYGGKILIARRNPTGQMGGRWEFPGGKVEAGEDERDAVIRELREEFGVTVSVGELIAETTFLHDGAPVALRAWRVFFPHDGTSERYALTEHTEYRWVNVSEIEDLFFVDSDMLVYPAVKSYARENGLCGQENDER
ncbi:MAG: (deoxy)nucleoside triphosphate pyrophosphohydrolase [Treponema sp.]|nr:(deoxy)nucleoside triphosphate pyrophosphohydrolase [Treponema sp.]